MSNHKLSSPASPARTRAGAGRLVGPELAGPTEAAAGTVGISGRAVPDAAAGEQATLDEWQREDGFPRSEYFQAVIDALAAGGVDVEEWTREEDWEFNAKLAESSYMDGPLRWARYGLWLSWRVDELDEPAHADDFTGLGWYWVPYSKSEQEALGDFAREFDGLAYLAEPADVAAAVADLIRPRRAAEGAS